MKHYTRISEYLWLMLSITCAGFTVYEFGIVKNTENGWYAVGFTIVASGMYALRRMFRKKMEKIERK